MTHNIVKHFEYIFPRLFAAWTELPLMRYSKLLMNSSLSISSSSMLYLALLCYISILLSIAYPSIFLPFNFIIKFNFIKYVRTEGEHCQIELQIYQPLAVQMFENLTSQAGKQYCSHYSLATGFGKMANLSLEICICDDMRWCQSFHG